MPPKGVRPGSPESEAYELLSRETSLDIPSGSSVPPNSGNSGGTRPMNVRHRYSQSDHENESTHEEIVGLLARSPFALPKSIRLSHGLGIALELITQSTPSLLFAVMGSVMTGMVFDQVQFWPAFVRVGELFILVPILLNLKGCLEMNLASRLSTSVSASSVSCLTCRQTLEN